MLIPSTKQEVVKTIDTLKKKININFILCTGVVINSKRLLVLMFSPKN